MDVSREARRRSGEPEACRWMAAAHRGALPGAACAAFLCLAGCAFLRAPLSGIDLGASAVVPERGRDGETGVGVEMSFAGEWPGALRASGFRFGFEFVPLEWGYLSVVETFWTGEWPGFSSPVALQAGLGLRLHVIDNEAGLGPLASVGLRWNPAPSGVVSPVFSLRWVLAPVWPNEEIPEPQATWLALGISLRILIR